MNVDTLLIINPISGTNHAPGLAARLSEALKQMGHNPEVKFTEHSGHARKMAAEAAASGVRSVLACGGDGTVNEVASALIGTQTVLGILPNGSGNGLARHIGIPCNPLGALNVIADNRPQSCDWCDIDGHPFFCAAGVGFDAAVVQRFSKKGRRGFITYLQSAVEEFRTYEAQQYTITTPDGELKTNAMFISLCNASQLGNNAYISPHASIMDGVMDITIVEKSRLLKYATMGVNLMGGALKDGDGLKMLRAKEVVIHRSKPGVAHADGELLKLGTEIHVKVHPADLRIYVNPFRRPVRPWLTPLHLDNL